MQKKTIVTLFLLIFLVSCASPASQPVTTSTLQPAAISTSTHTPSPIETTTPTITAAETMMSAKFEDYFNVTSWYELSGTEGGKIHMSCNFGVDRGLGNYKIEMPASLAHEICMEKVASYVHAWGANGVQGEQPIDAQVAEIEQMFVEVMNGARSPEDTVVTAPIYDLQQGLDGKYKMTSMSFAMGEMPAAERAEIVVEHINIVHPKGFGQNEAENREVQKLIPGFVNAYQSGNGYGALYDSETKTLILLAGPNGAFRAEIAESQLGRSMSALNNWIVRFGGKGEVRIQLGDAYTNDASDLIDAGYSVYQ